MKRIIEEILCYLVAAHILLWTIWNFLGGLIQEATK
jgi:hypothetical protein